MGILRRMRTVVKSEVNAVVDKVENTEKVLNQSVRDMQQSLVTAKQQVAVSIADEKRLERQHKESLAQMDSWTYKAGLAVGKGNDDLAKVALERKIEYEGLVAEYQRQWDAQIESVAKLKASLAELEQRIAKVEREKNLLIARNKRAVAQKQINETLSSMNTDTGSCDTFARMKRKVDQAEARAEAAEEIIEDTDGVEKQFAELEKPNLDHELAKLKVRLARDKSERMTINCDDPEKPILRKDT